MTVRVTKPEFNLREKLTELDKPTGTKGLDLMRSETTQEARNSVSVDRKNLIINGDMRVAQRATSTTSSGYQTVDRFSSGTGSTDEAPTRAQDDVASGTTPYTLGFRKAFRITNGNQTSGPQNGSEINVFQNIEAQDIVQSGWDYTSDSSFITWSFWIKSSVATNFYGYLRTYDNTAQGYAFETGNLSANVWTKIIKKIPGNPNININNDNGVGLQFRLLAYIGTAYSDNTTPLHKWTTYSSTARVPEPPTTWYNTNDATLEMTGWQVEVGSNATEFEHRSLGEELALCQRYFCIYHACTQEWVYIESATNTHKWWQTYVPTGMRNEPSVTLKGTCSTNNISLAGGGTISGLSVQAIDNGGNAGTAHPGSMGRVSYRVTCSGSFGNNYEVRHTDGWGNGAGWVEYDSEL